MTWLGYPSTTGLASIDFRLSDVVADPSGQTERLHSEKVLRLPNGYHTYAPLVETPEVLNEINVRPTRFGVFHNLAKFSDSSVDLWVNVLKQVPNSLLCLKAKGLGDPDVLNHIEQRFVSLGVAKDRLTLSPWQSPYGKHFEDFAEIDVMLDATPYNGTTTTCEALWMGVPVVTLCGDRTASRVGASLLTQIGHSEWIARSVDEYVKIAGELASAHQRRKILRSSLRQDLLASTLGDESLFARTVEGVYRNAWQQLCQQHASL
jgi:predicted O-linked N-acetylglucosamine transferase (SPINDLY family)